MLFSTKYNTEDIIKQLDDKLGISGYTKICLHKISCYIKCHDDTVTTVVVPDKVKSKNGKVHLYKFEFSRKLFMYKDEEHIKSLIETTELHKIAPSMATAVDCMYTVGMNSRMIMSLNGSTIEVGGADVMGRLNCASLLCVPDNTLWANRVEVDVSRMYPITEKELSKFDSYGNLHSERLVAVTTKEYVDLLKERTIGNEIQHEYNFEEANLIVDTLRYKDDVLLKALKKAIDTGEFKVINNYIRLKTENDIIRFIDIVRKVEV